MQRFWAAACLLLAAALAAGQQAPVRELPAFTDIKTCVPFNVLIAKPDGGPDYGLQVDGEAAVAAAVSANVSGGTVLLESGPFSTQEPIKASEAATGGAALGTMCCRRQQRLPA